MRNKFRRVRQNGIKLDPIKADPSLTAGIRRAFEAAVRLRVDRVISQVWKVIDTDDALGLKGVVVNAFCPTGAAPDGLRKMLEELEARKKIPPPTANTANWKFGTSDQKVEEFQRWLAVLFDQEMTGPEDKSLWTKFVTQAFTKGIARSFDDYMKTAPGGKKEKDARKEEFLRASFRQPVAVEKVKLLASRTFSDLRGVTQATGTAMTRVLAEGLARGDSPRAVALKLREVMGTVTKARALTIARTETIRAHAEGQLLALKSLGVENLGVQVEWDTAGDGKVCQLCRPMEGLVVPIEKASGMLPRHPNCRCAWKPHVPAPDGFSRVNGKLVANMAAVRLTQLYNRVYSLVINPFCPTGAGGGVDPSCKPGGGKFSRNAEYQRAKAAYPILKKGQSVDGRRVIRKVDNQSSIPASVDGDYVVLKGIREVSSDHLKKLNSSYTLLSHYAAADDIRRSEALADKIKTSNKISGLIVVDDGHPAGPYVLEGGHRFAALHKLGAKSLPAMVVLDLDSIRRRKSGELVSNRGTGGNCGIGAGGFTKGNRCAAGGAGDKAKFIGKSVGAAEHAEADRTSHSVAKALGGVTEEGAGGPGQKDKKPFDVRSKKTKGKGYNDVEVKTFLKGGKQVLSVHDDALLRKVDHAGANPDNTFHTVAVDKRKTYQGGEHSADYSGHEMYYKRGSGRYALAKMHKVKDDAELKRLMNLPDDKLPELAKGKLPPPPPPAKLRESAGKASEGRKVRDKARKERNKDKLREQAKARRELVKGGGQ